MIFFSTGVLLSLFRYFYTLGIMRSSNKDILGSFVQVWKLLDAIQTSWELDYMITYENGGLKTILEHFAPIILIFALALFASAKFHIEAKSHAHCPISHYNQW